MQHAAMKEGDTVLVRAHVVSTASDYIGVQIGNGDYRVTNYIPRGSIASVDATPDPAVIDALCGAMGRMSPEAARARAG